MNDIEKMLKDWGNFEYNISSIYRIIDILNERNNIISIIEIKLNNSNTRLLKKLNKFKKYINNSLDNYNNIINYCNIICVVIL